MKSCKQMAVVWGISERRVTEFCKEGMIPGEVEAFSNYGKTPHIRFQYGFFVCSLRDKGLLYL